MCSARRRPAQHADRIAWNRAERFFDASSVRAIRVGRIVADGACRAGRRRNWLLLAAGSIEHQRSEISGVRSREALGRMHRQCLNDPQSHTRTLPADPVVLCAQLAEIDRNPHEIDHDLVGPAQHDCVGELG